MDYEKKYKEALSKAKSFELPEYKNIMASIFPELAESEDERIRKALVRFHKSTIDIDGIKGADILAWLEKQGTSAKLSEEEQNSFSKGVLSNCALSFINYLDAHSYEGKMCVSNGECEDIENAFHNAMWDRLHRYYCKYIEKQDEQKPILDFKASNFYVSKVDGKLHNIYQSVDKIEQKPTSDTKYKVSAGGSLIIVNGKPFDYEHATITQKDFAPEQELKKIEDEIEIPFGAKDSELQEETYYIPKGFHAEIEADKVVIKKGEKPAAWSDEDDAYKEFVISAVEDFYDEKNPLQKTLIDWLKSLKDRIGG